MASSTALSKTFWARSIASSSVSREVASYVEGMKARGARLVFAEDHSISPNTRYESYFYALQVCREHMWY